VGGKALTASGPEPRRPGAAGRRAADGTPYPDRATPAFQRDVRAMFTQIARGYDRFDHIASLGNDLLWRPRALWGLDRFRGARPRPRRILDVGCGPGELGRLAVHHFPESRLVGIDFTRAMLRRAARPTPARGAQRFAWAEADALRLPFRDGTFDLVMSAFVVRNLPRLDAAFAEFRRVLAPGGTLLTLEITEPTAAWFRSLFHAYFDAFVPWLGAAVGNAGPYRYLPESLRSLPDRPAMLAALRAAGFGRSAALPQSLGIVTTYLAEAPALGEGLSGRARSEAAEAR
jgi:demethylmenaquinone methyltransferase / 2-methoxy-6-polyprenyl-1,4-benzoquinol methylase